MQVHSSHKNPLQIYLTGLKQKRSEVWIKKAGRGTTKGARLRTWDDKE